MYGDRSFVFCILIVGVFCMGARPACDLGRYSRVATHVVLQAATDQLPPDAEWDDAGQARTLDVLQKRLEILGVKGTVSALDSDKIAVGLPKVKDQDSVIRSLTRKGSLEFRHLHTVHYQGSDRHRPAASKYALEVSADEDGKNEFWFFDQQGNEVAQSVVLEESKVILTGNDLKPGSKADKDPTSFHTVVLLEFTAGGRREFAEFTRRNVDEILAIVLDGEILSAPTIKTPILDGRAIIEGRFEKSQAEELAVLLNAPPLPVPMKVISIDKGE